MNFVIFHIYTKITSPLGALRLANIFEPLKGLYFTPPRESLLIDRSRIIYSSDTIETGWLPQKSLPPLVSYAAPFQFFPIHLK